MESVPEEDNSRPDGAHVPGVLKADHITVATTQLNQTIRAAIQLLATLADNETTDLLAKVSHLSDVSSVPHPDAAKGRRARMRVRITQATANKRSARVDRLRAGLDREPTPEEVYAAHEAELQEEARQRVARLERLRKDLLREPTAEEVELAHEEEIRSRLREELGREPTAAEIAMAKERQQVDAPAADEHASPQGNLEQQVAALQGQLEARDELLRQREATIAEQGAQIEAQAELAAEKEGALKDKDERLAVALSALHQANSIVAERDQARAQLVDAWEQLADADALANRLGDEVDAQKRTAEEYEERIASLLQSAEANTRVAMKAAAALEELNRQNAELTSKAAEVRQGTGGRRVGGGCGVGGG